MRTAIVLFDRFTALDAVGPYETMSRIPGAETVFVAERTGPVRNDTGSLALTADRTLADVPDPDVVVVPGGPGQDAQMGNETLLDWLRAADAASTWTTSVCSGSLLLAAAGLLSGRRATSHWLALDLLKGYGAEPTGERVVTDGKYVTAAGCLLRHRHGPHPGRPDHAATSTPRRSSCSPSTTRSRPTTPGPRTRRPRTSSRSSARGTGSS